jgi:hypothetical protein
VVKQYSLVEPQKPLTEQQGKFEGHEYPSAPPPVPFFPHVLSGETTRAEISWGAPAAMAAKQANSEKEDRKRIMLAENNFKRNSDTCVVQSLSR